MHPSRWQRIDEALRLVEVCEKSPSLELFDDSLSAKDDFSRSYVSLAISPMTVLRKNRAPPIPIPMPTRIGELKIQAIDSGWGMVGSIMFAFLLV